MPQDQTQSSLAPQQNGALSNGNDNDTTPNNGNGLHETHGETLVVPDEAPQIELQGGEVARQTFAQMTAQSGSGSTGWTPGFRAQTAPERALKFARHFTQAGQDPFATSQWERRTASITGENGKSVFEQRDCEIPSHWSQLATNVVVSKYFRGPMESPARETSVRQVIGRVADTIHDWGNQGGYFQNSGEAQAFRDELVYLLLHQHGAFNSPVWFNLGVKGSRAQASACFINSVYDDMESIMELAATEARLFKGGSGAGTNLFRIRSSREQLSGGGIASGPVSFMRGWDAFAGAIKCLTPDAYVYTQNGLQTIGEVVNLDLEPGFHADESLVLATKDEPARISQVYVSPPSPTLEATLSHSGLQLRGTEQHPVLTLSPEFRLEWKALCDLQVGDHVAVSRRTGMWPENAPCFADFAPRTTWAKREFSFPTTLTPELARLLGYMVAEGCMNKERFRFCNADAEVFDDFLRCVQSVFGADASRNVRARVHPTTGVETRCFEAHWPQAVRFLQHVGLGFEKSAHKNVPWSVRQAPRQLVVEFLRAYFEGDGHVSSHIYAASASKTLLREVQLLLLNMGLMPHLRAHPVEGKTYWSLYLRGREAFTFAREVGLISHRKCAAAEKLGDKNQNTNIDTLPFLADRLRERAGRNGNFRCADGHTRTLGFGFFNRRPGSAISYSRLRATPRLLDNLRLVEPEWAQTLEFLLEREFFFDTVGAIEAREDAVTYDFTVPGPHSFIANGIVNHNSGGTTRRAAKMVILNADHPDIADFIVCKANEEKKAWALIDAGFNGGFNVPGGAYDSVAFQNANHSVRVTDEFMRAAENGASWSTRAITTGKVVETLPARDLLYSIAQTTHICGDPGLQYDTTLNDWHTCPNTGRINASNPCSEFVFLDDTACNLASINLLKFYDFDTGHFDAPAYVHACETFLTAQEIIVSFASYPTAKIAENSELFRPLGLGYCNIGALLMAMGLAYDSDEGRAFAGALTAIMTGAAYRQSARIARNTGPFEGYTLNREPMLRVIGKHRDAVSRIDHSLVAPNVMEEAQKCWDEALLLGQKHGYRNSQTTVLAPTGCLVAGSLISTDRGLVRLERLGNPNGAQWQDADFQVFTDGGVQSVTKFFINGLDQTRIITTEAGYSVQGTPRHRVKVVAPTGEWQWKHFRDIAAGDVLPLAMNTLIGEPQTVLLPPLGQLHWNGEWNAKTPLQMTAELAELVGYFMGDGSLHAKGLRFCVADGDEDVAVRLAELGYELFGLEAHQSQQKGYIEVALHSVSLALWWDAAGFSKAKPFEKHAGKGYVPRVPDAVLHSNDARIYGAFLRGLYEADGTLTLGVPSVSTAHADFSSEIRSLLLALGFPTSTKTDTSQWGDAPLYVSRLRNGSYNPRFQTQIGFIGARKSGGVVELKGALSGKRDRVFLPREVWDELVPVAHPLRNAVQIALKRHGAIARQLAAQIHAQTGDERVAHVLNFFFDAVESNENGGEQMTFDLSVPGNVTYTANGFVSHNTISFMMDADTTGVEPDIALVKYKKLVGGGLLKIVNQTVPAALRKLGYDENEIKSIIEYIDKNDTIEGAPGLEDGHLSVFDCAFKAMNGVRSIHHMGHVKMMAAAQPFLSGAISKTVNMPQDCTVEEIMDAYIQSWKLGVKAVAIYRDNSKRTQPLSTSSDAQKAEKKETEVKRAMRRKLPDERNSITHKFSIAGQEGYFMVGLYEDGSPGEIFIKMSKEGSTISGLMDSFAVAISMCLQYGVPLRVLVNKFSHTRFEPSGYTTNRDIPIAKSLMDYIFRWFDQKFHPNGDNGFVGKPVHTEDGTDLKKADRAPASVASAPVSPSLFSASSHEEGARNGNLADAQASLMQSQADSPPCPNCGAITVRSGSCYKCNECGTTTGCG